MEDERNPKSPAASVTPWGFRPLSTTEVGQLYLPLRMAVLGDELQRTKASVRTALDLWDRYDWTSTAFGCFHRSVLVGAVRLVVAQCPDQLPSRAFLDGRVCRGRHGGVAEVSRLVVTRPYRHLGIATRLVALALGTAAQCGMSNVIVTASAAPKSIEHHRALGFRVLCADFHCEDSLVVSPCPMATFHFDIPQRLFDKKCPKAARRKVVDL